MVIGGISMLIWSRVSNHNGGRICVKYAVMNNKENGLTVDCCGASEMGEMSNFGRTGG